MSSRRSFLQRAMSVGAGMLAASPLLAADPDNAEARGRASVVRARTRRSSPEEATNAPVITTEVGDLPYTLDGDVKVFRLTAQVVRQQVAPNKTLDLWGFNGSAPGPTIQVTNGDHVRVIFENQLPEPSSMHWHGFEDTIGNDGMPGISQRVVRPGERFVYEFDIHQEGTYFYHSHMAMQEMAGMLGGFIMHPKRPYAPVCDKDFLIHLQEYAALPNNLAPNTANMEFNWLLLNGRAGPAATPLIVRLGDRVRIRFVNLGMDHHPMHLHGHTFQVTGTEGGRIQESAWWPGNTVLVGVAQARDVEFIANNPGDWMLHCHLPHHMMNQMSSTAGGAGRAVDMATTNGPISQPEFEKASANMMRQMQSGEPATSPMQMRDMMTMDMAAANTQKEEIAANAEEVPGFPQDAYMEGPMMAVDALVQKPENYGLPQGWSRFMQGMMTFVRVLPPARYDEVIARMEQAGRPGDPYAALYRRGQ